MFRAIIVFLPKFYQYADVSARGGTVDIRQLFIIIIIPSINHKKKYSAFRFTKTGDVNSKNRPNKTTKIPISENTPI
jgi:hypothetical protein